MNGNWRGELSLGQTKLPIVFHFYENECGQTQCTIDSPMQGAKGIPTIISFCNTDSLSVEIKSIGASFYGNISGLEILGTFSQRGYSFPLNLYPEKSIFERRPQTPRKPFPYTSIDTTFISSDGTVLAGTLSIPIPHTHNMPGVVFITGSGPQNRDEEICDHQPFAVISDYLARNVVASFRYDDRGVAKSKGDFKTANIDTFKADADAAVNLLRSIDGVTKVGIIGHSEGGTIALWLASEGKADFAISLAGAIIKGKDMLLAQNLHLLDRLQISQKQRNDVITLISSVFDDIIDGKKYPEIDVDESIKERDLDIPSVVLASFRQNLAIATGSYYRQLISLDPSKWLGTINVPIMGLNGALDTQVASNTNLKELKRLVPHAKIKEYTGLNHLFQHGNTGEISEYTEITETISEDVLTDIKQFISNLQ